MTGMTTTTDRGYFVVNGMHRSGTTLTGKILACYPGLHVIHEPFNRDHGLKGVHHVYPCDLDLQQRDYYLDLLDRLFAGDAGYIRRVPGDSAAKAAARAVIGGKTGLDMAGFRLRRIRNAAIRPVLKDPFTTLLTGSLIANGHRAITLVRHPAAIWLSIRRMGWRFSFDHFAYPGILAELGLSSPAEPLGRSSEVEKFALLWTIIHTYLQRLPTDGTSLLVRHEDLCRDPLEVVDRIEACFNLEPSNKTREFVAKNMFGAVVTAENRQLHVFERDSRSLATSWYDRLETGDETVLRTICGPLVEQYYGAWQPL
jgi:hypothetical protein